MLPRALWGREKGLDMAVELRAAQTAEAVLKLTPNTAPGPAKVEPGEDLGAVGPEGNTPVTPGRPVLLWRFGHGLGSLFRQIINTRMITQRRVESRNLTQKFALNCIITQRHARMRIVLHCACLRGLSSSADAVVLRDDEPLDHFPLRYAVTFGQTAESKMRLPVDPTVQPVIAVANLAPPAIGGRPYGKLPSPRFL
jgi:hypothetical protein